MSSIIKTEWRIYASTKSSVHTMACRLSGQAIMWTNTDYFQLDSKEHTLVKSVPLCLGHTVMIFASNRHESAFVAKIAEDLLVRRSTLWFGKISLLVAGSAWRHNECFEMFKTVVAPWPITTILAHAYSEGFWIRFDSLYFVLIRRNSFNLALLRRCNLRFPL